MSSSAAPRRRGLQIGRVAAVPILLAPSWFLFAAFLVVVIAPRLQQDLGPTSAYVLAGCLALLLLLSVLLHEIAHCLVARAFDLPVSSITITVMAGLTEITEPPRTPAQEYAVAVSGPMVSLLLAAVGIAATPLFDGAPVPQQLCEYVAITNGFVAAFNLLPGLPLDGGRVLKSVVWQLGGDRERATRASARSGRVLALVLVPVILLAVRPALGTGDTALSTSVFAALLAAFIYAGATVALRTSQRVSRLPSVSVARLARPALVVPAGLPLSEAVRQAHQLRASALVVADSSGVLQGVVSEVKVRAVPLDRRPWVSVADGSRRIEPGLLLDPALAGEDLLLAMRTTPASEYVVPGKPPRVLVSADVAAAVGR